MSALRVLSNNENRTAIAFQTAEYDIFKFFHTPSTFGTGNRNEAGGIFYIPFGAPDYWMNLLCAQPQDPQFITLGVIHERHTHTDTQTDTHTQSRP
jgi:hypothetical protein